MMSNVYDSLSNYFIHYSNNLGLILTSQQLVGNNYDLWSRAMIITLFLKKKFEFINEIWEDLQYRFQQSNGSILFQLPHEIFNHQKNQDYATTYFTKLKVI
ncbi:unnamed protein product [Spirodela intermedia]|uniref:Retrotransposon Copia-like N-terminal domain-containing protein n=1 Tax=Spirodela intermedia TaxID=51605 RepID=A0A7I8LLY7_SPIIN|nr:unnamed protein product [Spirodela intermedia]